MQILMQMLLSKLQQRNPQGYQTIQSLANSNGDPTTALQQIMQNVTPEQRQGILTQAKSFGAPDVILSQFQNMK